MKPVFVNIIQSHKVCPGKEFYRIPGTIPVCYHLEEGQVLVQEWDLADYSIQYIQSLLSQKIVFEMRHQGEAEILVCCLKARLEINSFSNPPVKLNPEYAYLYAQANFQAFCILKSAKRNSALLFITHTGTHLPEEKTVENALSHPFLMQARMMEMVEKVIYTSYAEKKPFHYQQIIELMATGRQPATDVRNWIHFDEFDLSCIHAAKEWLDKNMDKEYSEQAIMQRAGMNIRKLNKGFANLFGQTPYHYLRLKRLVVAHEKIMDTNTNLKTIAKHAGYRSYTNFSSAFKKHFGYSPVFLRKKESL